MTIDLERIAWARWMGVAMLVLMLVSIVPSVMSINEPGNLTLEYGLVALMLAISVTYTCFILGLVALGKELKHERLARTGTIAVWLSVVSGAIASFNSPVLIPVEWSIALTILTLVLMIPFGIVSIRLGKDFKELEPTLGVLAKKAGKWNGIAGYLMVSVLLSPFGVLLSLIADYYMWRVMGEYVFQKERGTK